MTNARISEGKREPGDERLDGIFFINDIAANKFDHSLRLDDQVKHVEPKVMDLLVQLAAAPRQPVNRTDLLDCIWPNGGAAMSL
ncbi:winged helix-turn-helix domain-containing protein [Parasphingorhabdus halotolerans]|uniref:OmpR/PhoB-type domain-containing protein n=1 Tax=Parasphingorhabdus halotolerans TaxID=2725558 RepID=A0A6H2DR83_9SPHN|nr:hypothetical protein [Parasphingorhabdus halotolerans]QJB70271.1 hypothetical protein HF685_14130 [Parasphingorhabdus halotolerans]